MTIAELRELSATISEELLNLADSAERDDFAPWVVEALRHAAWTATLNPHALSAAEVRLEEANARRARPPAVTR